jgi:serine phosphatase RsbU (regulator of sigma subunit)
VGIASSLSLGVKEVLDSRGGVSSAAASANLVHLLAEAGRLLVLPRPLKETCDQILEIVEKAVPASRLVLLLRPEPGAEPVQIAARYRGGVVRDPLVLSRAIMHKVLDELTSVLITDAAADQRFQKHESIMAQSVHSAMAVPLFDNEKVLGLLYADDTRLTVFYSQEQLEVLTILANMAAVKITNGKLLVAEGDRIRMEQELAAAMRIQRNLLPAAPTGVPGWCFHAYLQSCFEVGGDLYDFHRRDDGSYYFLVGDVSGKGMGAALLMTSILTSARILYDQYTEPGDLVTRLSDVIYRSTEPQTFATAFVGHLDPATGVLRYVNAGHPPPLVVGNGSSRELEATGVPIGIMSGFRYPSESVELARGETLILYSDGIPEAMRGAEFFVDEKMQPVLIEAGAMPTLEESSRFIIGEVEAFTADEPRGDDITLLLVRRE